MKTRLINISNGKKYKRLSKTRHHTTSCSYCDRRFKMLKPHYQLYHPGILEKQNERISKALSKGEVGSISGVRFIQTK